MRINLIITSPSKNKTILKLHVQQDVEDQNLKLNFLLFKKLRHLNFQIKSRILKVKFRKDWDDSILSINTD